MSYWWRLYAHLAPLLPDSPILQRVEANARAGATQPHWKDRGLMVGALDATRLMKRMRHLDGDELREASEDLHWTIRNYAKKNDRDERKVFIGLCRVAFKDPKLSRSEYFRIFQFYRGKKMKRGPE